MASSQPQSPGRPGTDPALVFGEVAELYQRVRPEYPEALVDAVLAYGPVPAGGRMLEVGCGTGKATVAFARRGLRVSALEPSPEMASVARRLCAPYPDVEIVEERFEDWSGAAESLDLILSTSAWHWVDPAIGYQLAWRALRPAGVLAVVWPRHDAPPYPGVEAAYRRHAAGLADRDRNWVERSERRRRSFEKGVAGLFAVSEHRAFTFTREMGTADYLGLLATYSDHRLLDPATRERLLDAIGAAIDDAGGRVSLPYTVDLFLARPGSRRREPSGR